MRCEIEWNSLELAAWDEKFAGIRRSNLLQSYDYARAVCPLNRHRARWGLVRIDGQEAGLVQIFEAGIFGGCLHAVMLDRGPLWFVGFGAPAHIAAFFAEFDRQFPSRFGRRRRIIPESIDFANENYKRLPRPGYQTIWLDLTGDTETLRANLAGKWRNHLHKAERAGLSVEWDREGETLPWLLTHYQTHRREKGYDGPSPQLLRALAKSFAPAGRMLVGRAVLDNQAIAAILILGHGRSATYQLGWNSDTGRTVAAHNYLLWQAVCHLKEQGFTDFDLGGVNDDTAKGVRDFKEGMGGEKVIYAGHYC